MTQEKRELVKGLMVASAQGSISTSKLYEQFGGDADLKSTGNNSITAKFQEYALEQGWWMRKDMFGMNSDKAAGVDNVRLAACKAILQSIVKDNKKLDKWEDSLKVKDMMQLVRDYLEHATNKPAVETWYACVAYLNLKSFISTKRAEVKDQEKRDASEVKEVIPEIKTVETEEETTEKEEVKADSEEINSEEIVTIADVKAVALKAVENIDTLEKEQIVEILQFIAEIAD